MSKWPIGVFASVDAGLGVHFDVVKELGIPSIQLHTPHKERAPQIQVELSQVRRPFVVPHFEPVWACVAIAQAELVVLPGVGHFPHMEDPEGFALVATAFLEAITEDAPAGSRP